jgi:hypothetical protein
METTTELKQKKITTTEIQSVIFKLLIGSTKETPITAGMISILIKNRFNLTSFPPSKVRAYINEFRRDELPVLASNRGYWVSYDMEQMLAQSVSMKCRIDIQIAALQGLKNCIENVKNHNDSTNLHKLP